MPIAFALEVARAQKTPIAGFALAALSGLLVGGVFSFLLWNAGGALNRFSSRRTSMKGIASISAIALSVIAWIGFSGWCGERLAIIALSLLA